MRTAKIHLKFLITLFAVFVTLSVGAQIKIIDASISVGNVSCNGGTNGTVTFTTQFGVGPFSYIITGPSEDTVVTAVRTYTFTGLPAGDYILIARDKSGKFDVKFPSVIEPDPVDTNSTTTTITNVTCNGGNNGAINLDIKGGTAPYTYLWSNGATTSNNTGLTKGTYSVTVTDSKGCPFSASFDVTEPPLLTVSSSITNILCNGGNTGAIDVTVNGGTPPYTYSWSNGSTTEDLTGLTQGTYSITVTDANACTKILSSTVTQNPIIAISGTTTNVSCNSGNNGAINLTVSGGVAPYTYLWSNSATTQNISSLSANTYSVTVTDNKGCSKNASFTITEPTPMVLSGTTIDVLCNGGNNGSITLTVSGGTAPYSYSWSNGATTQNISSLVANNYTVTITDNKGCTKSSTFTINQPAALSLSGAVTNASCTGVSNGSVNLTVSGGTAPFTYSWSNGAITQNISGLAANTYTVTVTDSKGCTKSGSYTVTAPSVMTLTGVTTNVSCYLGNNGAIDLTVSGGATPYTYSWSNGAPTQDISGLGANTYTVTVTDNGGCIQNKSFTITQPAAALAVSGTPTDVLCNGGNNGSIVLNVTGGTAPYSYSWSNGATTQNISSLVANTYIVNVTDNKGCTKNASFTINQPTAMVISGTPTDVTCNGSNNGAVSISVVGGTAPYTYSWSNGATTQNISSLAANTYTVTVTDNKGCSKNASFTVNQPTVMTLSSANTNVSCFAGNNGAIDLSVAGGTAPYTYTWNTGATTQDISGLVANTYSVTVKDNNGCTQAQSFTITQPATALSISGTKTDVTCNGGNNGAVTLTVSGGTSPYTYAWSNGATTQNISGLVANTYTVTVTDSKGCTKNASFTITQPTPISVTGTTTDVSCNGGNNGAISLTVSGGNSPYTYTWNNGATTQNISGLVANTYTVTVKDNSGCTQNASFTINQPAPLSLSGTATNASCTGVNNGSINLTVSGGTSPYSYSWSNGATTQNISGLAANTYTVTVTDSKGCTKNTSFTVTQPALMTLTGTTTNVNCFAGNNGAIDLSVAGGASPYSYSWSNGASTQDISGLVANTYTVTVTDNGGCSQNQSFTITQPATALTVSGTKTDVTCNGGNDGAVTLTVSGGTSPYTYAWSNGATTQNISGLVANTYTVTVTDSKGCTKNVSFTITQPTPISVTGTTTDVSCNGGNNGAISLTVSGGNSPYTYTWSNGATTQNISSLVANTYTVTVKDNSGCTQNASFTINQPAPLSLSGTATNASCTGVNNGSINLTVSGGTSPYSYSWSNGATTQNISGLAANTYTVTVTDSKGCTKNTSFTVTQPALMTLTGTTTNVNCFAGNNGAIDLSVAGGASPYSYSWSNGASTQDISGLVANTYTVTVTDNGGCSQNQSFTITQPATALTVSGTKTDVTCNGGNDGSVTLTVSGGTSPYTYAWSNGATTQNISGLVANTYTVTVTDSKGCTKNVSFTITQPTPISVTGTTTDVSCNGGNNGAISISVSGGNSPYTYTWTNGATTQNISSLVANSYTVTVKDNSGCTQNASFTINEPAPLTISGSVTDASCTGVNNGSINLTVTGGNAPFTYSWSNGANTQNISGLAANSYSVTVTDNKGCTQNASFTVTQPAIMTLTSTNTDVSCNGGNNGAIDLSVTGGASPYSYSWSNGATTQDISGLIANSYTVIVTDNGGCTQNQSFTITEPATPLNVSGIKTDVTCNGGSNGDITLTVAGGTSPYIYSWSNSATTQNLSGLSANTYTVDVTDSKGCIKNASFVINEPIAITISGTTTDVTCNGGNNGVVTISVSGGNSPYTYSWDNGATTQNISGLTANTYTITVTDNSGCTQNASYTINEPIAITLSGSVTDATCTGVNNGSINLSVSGGTAPFTYTWSNGANTQNITGLGANSFTVTVTDNNGCIKSASFNVGQPAVMTLTNSNTDVTCNGGNNGAIDLTVASGTAPYTFSWDNGATSEDISGLTANTYTVTVTDNNGCTQNQSFTINGPAAPLSVTGTKTDVTCNGGNNGDITLTVTGGTTPYSFSWSNSATTQNLSSITANTYTVDITDNNGCTANASFVINEPAPVVITGTTTDVICNSATTGAIDVTVTGGTSPFTYSWSNGGTTEDINNIGAGNYTITITDANSCTKSASFTINEPTPISITAVTTDATCNGGNDGAVDITVSGGTGAYTFVWSNGANTEDISNLTAGNYVIMVTDANSCSQNAVFQVKQPNPISVTGNVTSPSCGGKTDASITTSVSGGKSPYTYLWNDGSNNPDLTNISNGSYSVIVTDNNGCSQNTSFNVSAPLTFAITLNTTNIICNGNSTGQIDITNVTGGSGSYTYALNNGGYTGSTTYNNLNAGSYTISVKDGNGCTQDTVIAVTEPSALNLTANFISPICAYGNSGVVDLNGAGGTAPYQYSSDKISFTAANQFSNLNPGTYTFYIQDNSGCIDSTSATLASFPQVDLAAIRDSLIHLKCNGANTGEFHLKNVTGGTSPYTYRIDGGSSKINPDFLGLSAGIHFITITDANNCNYQVNDTIKQPAAIDFNLNLLTLESCNNGDGSFSLSNVTGGVGPYTFKYDTLPTAPYTGTVVFDSLHANIPFTVTVKDSYGCGKIETLTIPNKPAPIPYVTINDTHCKGLQDGEIVIDSIEGGVPNFDLTIKQINSTFTQSNNGIGSNTTTIFNGLAADTFNLIIRDQDNCDYLINEYYSYNDLTQKYDTIYDSDMIVKDPTGPTPFVRIKKTHCIGSKDGEILVDSIWGGSPNFDVTVNQINSAFTQTITGIAYDSSITFTGLAADTFNLTITDQYNCPYTVREYFRFNDTIQKYDTLIVDSINTNFIIKQPAPIQADIIVSNSGLHLNSGSALATNFTGGTRPYYFSTDSITFNPVVRDSVWVTGLGVNAYKLHIVDSLNCPYTISYSIGAGMYIPNLISPNGDGHNDYFEILGLPINTELKIFSKWGSRVYYSKNYDNSWDGEHDTDGVYYFELTFPDNNVYKGWVEVVR